jgi:hypothetical protein
MLGAEERRVRRGAGLRLTETQTKLEFFPVCRASLFRLYAASLPLRRQRRLSLAKFRLG